MIAIPLPLQRAVHQRLIDDLTRANNRLNRDYPLPTINYRQRGTSAGSAHCTRWEIRLNAALLLANQHHFIDQVIPHELAHLLVYRHFGRCRPHGREWQTIMRDIFQVTPKRTHDFDIQIVQGVTYSYQCACQTHQLTARRHHYITSAQRIYRCRNCAAILAPIESVQHR